MLRHARATLTAGRRLAAGQQRAFSFLGSPLTSASVELSTLPNGVVIASQPWAGPVVSMGVYNEVGSRIESAQTSGMCALISKAKLLEFTPAIEAMGGRLNSVVTRDGTSYTATVLKESAAAAAAVLAKCLSAPVSADKFAAAAAATVDDIKDATFDETIIEELHSCAFLDTQLGAPVRGTAGSVAALTAADAAPFFTATYGTSPLRAVGVGAGAELAAALADAKAAPAGGLALAKGKPMFTGSDKKISFDSYPVATVTVAYEFPAMDSEYGPAAVLMPELMGFVVPESLSGIDPINVHAKCARELAAQECILAFEPFYTAYKDTALFGFKYVCKDTNVEDAMWYTMNNMVRLCYEVTDVELARAKEAYATKMRAACASPEGLVGAIAPTMLLLGAPLSPAELVARVETVTLEDIKKTAYKFIHDNDHACAACGPLHELPDYSWVRSASYNYHY
ncbi:Metalloenzyme, LuxS/M16 peptidase-like protein [Pelagophyceae sp. CCMP2097]|nr:Metalloenzyme, LuxS/M16 peptidase-like protein [Pelagophyceae sp. CCMP2097]